MLSTQSVIYDQESTLQYPVPNLCVVHIKPLSSIHGYALRLPHCRAVRELCGVSHILQRLDAHVEVLVFAAIRLLYKSTISNAN